MGQMEDSLEEVAVQGVDLRRCQSWNCGRVMGEVAIVGEEEVEGDRR